MSAHAPQIALEPDVLAAFTDAVSKRGLVGEDQNAKILFLTVVSRLLDKPVSVVVKGTSSGGKSFTVESVLAFFLRDAYYARTAMSEKALVYSEEPLKNRFLVIYEAVGMENGFSAYALRSLLSENKLVYEFVENGKARVISKDGPTGLIITTTKASLHPENETRLLSLTVTDTPEQTRNILRAMASETVENHDYTEWHEFQAFLAASDCRVVIPFADMVALLVPPQAVRLRRDMRQVLSLIKAHAIVHQLNRERDSDGRIIATLRDYAAVHGLISTHIAQGVAATVPVEVREVVEAVKMLARSNPSGVSFKTVGDHLSLDKSSAKRRCDDAIERGYLKNMQTRKNQPAQILLGDPLPEDKPVLPPPDVLEAALASVGSGCTVAEKTEGVADAEAA